VDSPIVLTALRNAGTLFSEKVETAAEALETTILSYHSVATRKRAGTSAFRPVWLPSLHTEQSSGSPTPP
jgi:nuclear pore complex protein Nup205